VKKLTSCIDWNKASKSADQVVLAYEIGDAISAHAEDIVELQADALVITQIVTAYGLINLGVNEKVGWTEFLRIFRATQRVMEKLGKDARLSDVVVEMGLA
jgi:hypothetical protein